MTRRSQRSTHRSRQSAAASSTVHADSTPLVDSPVQHSSVQHSSVTATTTLTPPRVFFRYLWADFVRTLRMWRTTVFVLFLPVVLFLMFGLMDGMKTDYSAGHGNGTAYVMVSMAIYAGSYCYHQRVECYRYRNIVWLGASTQFDGLAYPRIFHRQNMLCCSYYSASHWASFYRWCSMWC